jgi:hypothetical protein
VDCLYWELLFYFQLELEQAVVWQIVMSVLQQMSALFAAVGITILKPW